MEFSSTLEDMEQQNYQDLHQDQDLQGCCYYYLIVRIRGLEHSQETN